MTRLLQNSLFIQLLLRLGAFFRLKWRESAVHALGSALGARYESSLSRRVWDRFCEAEDPTPRSLYGRFCARLLALWQRFGLLLEQSLCCHALRAVGRFYRRITEGSVVFGWINCLGLHQWFLVAFALYLPINCFLRDVVGIALLSSVWEEAFLLAAFCLILWRTALRETDAVGRTGPLDLYLWLFFAVGFLLMCLVQPWPAIA